MRLTRLARIVPRDSARPLVFEGSRGERFEVSVLEDYLVRVRLCPDGRPRLDRTWSVVGKDGDVPREGRRRDDLSPFSQPACEVRETGGIVQLKTPDLCLSIRTDPVRLAWADRDGREFAADLAKGAYAYDRAGRKIFHSLCRRSGEHYFGLGETSGPLDKAGRRIRLRPMNALGYNAETGDPLYKHLPFYITFLPEMQLAYGLFYDNLADTTFDLGCEVDDYLGSYRVYAAEDGDLDCYVIYGPGLEQVVERFSALVGRPVLPPRWSLGYLGSAMSYADAPDAQAQLRRFAEQCAEHRIPCDLFHLSSGYTLAEDGKRYVFTWNRRRFPDPPGMTQHFHEAGIKVAANIKPCLLTTHPAYPALAEQGGFVRNPETGRPDVSDFWQGDDGSFIDFTSAAGYDWWQARVRDALLAVGVDATWNDNNEYVIWDDEAQCAGFGEPIRIGLVRPLHALLMTRASYEAQRAARPSERPYLISRSGCAGIQRYAQSWSGDNVTSWHTLRWNIPMGLSSSLSGMPNVGHDVGGFTGYRTPPELFVRWVQSGIFHPRFTIHSWHLDGTVNEPWMYPEVLPLVRAAIELRYRLIPYLYTLLFEAARTGRPIVRPLVYAFPGDPACRAESFDFLLGPSLLVASVLEDGARTRSVYLPAPGPWCDFHTGEWHEGGQTVDAKAPLDRIPLFVPAGGIIPLGKLMRHVGAEADDLRQAYVFPHPRRGSAGFTLIEDDGLSLAYQRGEYAEVCLDVQAEAGEIFLRARTRRAAYALPYRQIEFVLPQGETRAIRADTPTSAWTDHEGRRHVVVPLG